MAIDGYNPSLRPQARLYHEEGISTDTNDAVEWEKPNGKAVAYIDSVRSQPFVVVKITADGSNATWHIDQAPKKDGPWETLKSANDADESAVTDGNTTKVFDDEIDDAYMRVRVDNEQSHDVYVVTRSSPTGDLEVTTKAEAEHAEDTAHSSGDIGSFQLAVREDGRAALVDADGDYMPLAGDGVNLYVDDAALGDETATGDAVTDETAAGTQLQFQKGAVEFLGQAPKYEDVDNETARTAGSHSESVTTGATGGTSSYSAIDSLNLRETDSNISDPSGPSQRLVAFATNQDTADNVNADFELQVRFNDGTNTSGWVQVEEHTNVGEGNTVLLNDSNNSRVEGHEYRVRAKDNAGSTAPTVDVFLLALG